jgi:5-methyltetrahydropteroyltriglutamate--homocysteine methyltransferase
MARFPPITIPTEPIGTIPRPADLIGRVSRRESEYPNLAALYEDAVQNTFERFEAIGSPVVTKYHKGGSFRHKRYADSYLEVAIRYAHVPVKQAVISPAALSLMYAAESISDYSREQSRGH